MYMQPNRSDTAHAEVCTVSAVRQRTSTKQHSYEGMQPHQLHSIAHPDTVQIMTRPTFLLSYGYIMLTMVLIGHSASHTGKSSMRLLQSTAGQCTRYQAATAAYKAAGCMKGPCSKPKNRQPAS